VPSFWGDDKAITIQCFTDIDCLAYKVPIDDSWAGPADSNFVGSDNNITRVNDFDVAMPIMHRRAARSLSAFITFSLNSITFTDIAIGSTSTKNVTLTNSSDRDINIYIALTGSPAFTHNGMNTVLPRNNQMTITMKFTPKAPGLTSATLIITSDADIPTNQLSVTGTTASSETNYYPTFS